MFSANELLSSWARTREGRWPARPGCGVRGLGYSALAGEHSLHCGPPPPSAKTDARRALPLSLSSTRQQSDETLHVQWFGGLVENASGMSRMLCALDASFSSAYSFFVLAFNEWLFKTSLVNGRGDLTESLSFRLDVPQVFWSLRPRTPGRRHVAGRAHAIFFCIRSSSETASWISKGRGAGQAHSGMQISGNADRLLPAFTTTAKEDRIVASLSITPKDWPAAVRSRLNPCVHGSCGVLPR